MQPAELISVWSDNSIRDGSYFGKAPGSDVSGKRKGQPVYPADEYPKVLAKKKRSVRDAIRNY